MSINHKKLLLPFIFALALLAAFALTSPVLAQDEVPPEAPVEEPPVEEIPAGEIAPALEDTVESPASPDPWYKVGTTTYNFTTTDCDPGTSGDQGCTEPIEAAIQFIIDYTGLPSDGMIYVETGTYPDYPVIDASTDPVLSGFKGLIGSVVDGVPTVVLNGEVYIRGVISGFTLKGFDIRANSANPAIKITGSKGTIKLEDVILSNHGVGGSGLEISSQNGSVTIARAEVDGSMNGGGAIDNTLGTYGVTITNSSFSQNTSNTTSHVGGLKIATRGAVSLTGVTAYGNTGGEPGFFIQQSGALSIKNSVFAHNDGWGLSNDYTISTIAPVSTITLANVFANGNADGIWLQTKGAISLSDINASNNANTGAILDTCHVNGAVCEWAGSGAVTIKNSFFDENKSNIYSLSVLARGAITLTNVSVSRNADPVTDAGGANLDNSASQIVAAVKVTNGWFDGNDRAGLVVSSRGAVTLSNISSSDNGGNGTLVDNTYAATTSAGVTISGLSTAYSQFNNNLWDYGLFIYSRGAVSIKYVNCSGNSYTGAGIVNNLIGSTGGVTISYSTLNDNNFSNLNVSSRGAIKLTTIEVNRSASEHGANLQSIGNPATSSVSITNTLADGNDRDGLHIVSAGAVIISGGHASDNGGYGVEIDNTYAADTAPKSATIKNFTANGNAWSGFYVFSKGVISLSGVTANNNQSASEAGIYLVNNILAAGVTLSRVQANGNENFGIQISSNGAVKLSYGETSHNGDTGTFIDTRGSITLSNEIAIDNGYYGVDLNNFSSITHAAVTITGSAGGNVFSGNATNGLRVLSLGAVSLKYITADNNLWSGIYVDNYTLGTGLGNVTASYINTRGNGSTGLEIESKGIVTLSTVISMFNADHGIFVISHDHKAYISYSVSIANAGSGIRAEVGPLGTLTVTSTLYFGNDTDNTGDLNLQVIH